MGREKMGVASERANLDFYATNPKDVVEIMNLLNIDKGNRILDPCAGNGHISKTLETLGYEVTTNDIIKRNIELDFTVDFLKEDIIGAYDLVVVNPPFKYAKEFILKSLEYAPKVLVIAKLDLLESMVRKELNNKYLEKIFVHSKRAKFAKNGEQEFFDKGSSSMSTGWFIYNRNKSKEYAELKII